MFQYTKTTRFLRCFSRVTLYCIVLHFITGCSYTRNHQLPTVLTSDDVILAIKPNQPFKAIDDADSEPKEYVINDTLIVMRMGSYQELLEKSDTRFFKKARISKKQATIGGGIVSVLGIIATVFWNRRRKFKIDAGLKAEG